MVTIRNYREEDFAAVCAVHDRARPDELIGSLPPEAFRRMAEVAEEDEFFASQTIVACDASGAVVGFASWRDAYVTWMYVEPRMYRQGVGTRLLQETLRRIGPEAWLNTLAGNQAAIAFYRKAGFDIVREFESEADGYPCRSVRLALPTSPMHDPAMTRRRFEQIVRARTA